LPSGTADERKTEKILKIYRQIHNCYCMLIQKDKVILPRTREKEGKFKSVFTATLIRKK